MGSKNDKAMKAGVILIILGIALIIAGVIVSFATSPSSPASIALWVIGGVLLIIGIIIVSGGIRFQAGPQPQ